MGVDDSAPNGRPGHSVSPRRSVPPGPERPGLRRRLIRRIPPRLRRHWMLPAGLVAFIVVAALVFGGLRVSPVITGAPTVVSAGITRNIEGADDLFDDSQEHTVSVHIPDAQYRRMVDAYVDDGDKKWVDASVTIDGVVLEDVGVRLKGNSTLRSLRGGGMQAGGMPVGGRPGGEGQPDSGPAGEADDGGPGGMAGMASQMDPDDPQTLPLLLSFDKYVEGRAYQGMTELAVRPGSPVINEAMALSLTADSGQSSQRFAYAVYSVNGSPTTTRLLLENPDASYARRLSEADSASDDRAGARGYLYKADATSRFAYVGDDQSDYSDQFTQINAADSGNLQPVIDLLEWVDEASDEEFDEHLADHVDVDSLARYVATQNLLGNSDDMAGPGQNYYLWYSLGTDTFTVISWDLDLAMTGGTSAGPDDSVSMGGGPGRGGPPGGLPPGDAAAQQRPAGDGGAPAPPGGDDGAAGPPSGDGSVGAAMGGNTLKSRFLASDAFSDAYHRAYWDLYEQFYGSGHADAVLDGLAASIPDSDALSADELAGDVADMRDWIDERTRSLAEQRGA